MTKSLNIKLILISALSLMLFGCQDWDPINGFDEGDTRKELEEQQIGFFPLSQEVSEDDGVATIELQLIAEQQNSDVDVDFSVDGESSAEEGVHYEITHDSPATIESGSNTVEIEVELLDGNVENEVVLMLNLDSASNGIEVAENLDSSTMFIQEAEEE